MASTFHLVWIGRRARTVGSARVELKQVEAGQFRSIEEGEGVLFVDGPGLG